TDKLACRLRQASKRTGRAVSGNGNRPFHLPSPAGTEDRHPCNLAISTRWNALPQTTFASHAFLPGTTHGSVLHGRVVSWGTTHTALPFQCSFERRRRTGNFVRRTLSTRKRGTMPQKLAAEFFGTFWLVFCGCG